MAINSLPDSRCFKNGNKDGSGLKNKKQKSSKDDQGFGEKIVDKLKGRASVSLKE